LLGEKGIPKDSKAGRQQFSREMERRRSEQSAKEYEQIRRGWFLGSEEFRKELLASAAERIGLSHYGAERRESELARAERIVRQELSRLAWKEKDLGEQPKGHADKVAIASRLRRESTMSLKWIAQRLQMGSWTYVSNLLAIKPKSQKKRALFK
jgi:hypothetical protein